MTQLEIKYSGSYWEVLNKFTSFIISATCKRRKIWFVHFVDQIPASDRSALKKVIPVIVSNFLCLMDQIADQIITYN